MMSFIPRIILSSAFTSPHTRSILFVQVQSGVTNVSVWLTVVHEPMAVEGRIHSGIAAVYRGLRSNVFHYDRIQRVTVPSLNAL